MGEWDEMLGHFLEFSFAARPIGASFEFYRSLGFRTIPVSDVVSEPYAAFFDGAIAIGIHERHGESPTLTFVRPHLKDYVRALRRLGLRIEHAHLADDEFHRIDIVDPNGQAITLIEARTFPPGDWDPHNVCACGEFLEYSLATDSIPRSRAFWEAFGFSAVASGETPHSWLRLSGHGLVLGLHEARFRAGLSFRSHHVAARVEYLKAKGLEPKTGAPLAASAHRSATLLAPERTALYLIEEPPTQSTAKTEAR